MTGKYKGITHEKITKDESHICEYCDENDLKTKFKTKTWKGYVLFGYPIHEINSTTNKYCKRCLPIHVKPEDELDYIAPVDLYDEATYELNIENNYIEENNYSRSICIDKRNKYYAIFTASSDHNNSDKYNVICELAKFDSRYIIEREEPSISADNLDEALNKCEDLYESYWDSQERSIEWSDKMSGEELKQRQEVDGRDVLF